jgi:hypothetical protein
MSANAKGRLAFGVKPPRVEINFDAGSNVLGDCFISTVLNYYLQCGTSAPRSWHSGAKFVARWCRVEVCNAAPPRPMLRDLQGSAPWGFGCAASRHHAPFACPCDDSSCVNARGTPYAIGKGFDKWLYPV